jgi:hypothetical protein
MARFTRRSRAVGDSPDQPSRRRRWVTTIPVDKERRLYFLAILALVGGYLLDRLL